MIEQAVPDEAPLLCRDCGWLERSTALTCPACGSRRVVRHAELFALNIAHLDCDAFYAAVEKRDAPELRDVPVIVGGGRRGVVTTACYIARLSGVKSAMPMFKALRLCPQAVVIKPAFAKYRAESRRVMERLRALTPLVQPLSLDEAWLDLSGTERLHGRATAATLARLQSEIERDIGITVSVGLAPNKFLAKIASEIDKPRGFGVIGAADAVNLLAPRPVSILPGVGPAFAKALASHGIERVGDLTKLDPVMLFKILGPAGVRLWRLARGEDDRRVDPDQVRKSISAETTFEIDKRAVADLEQSLWPLCERVARTARAGGVSGRVVTLKLRAADFRIITRRRTLDAPTQTARTLLEVARDLLRGEAGGQSFRLIGVGLSDLSKGDGSTELFGTSEDRILKVETTMDALVGRFGDQALVRARGLQTPQESANRAAQAGERASARRISST